MAQRTNRKSDSDIRISMSCLAEFVTSYGKSSESRLRPFKFNKRGEGFARSSYYQYALRTIRAYHTSGNDPGIFSRDLQEMRLRADKATENWERIKFERNASAVEAYRRIYGNRKFKILPNRRLEYQIGGIVITAQADLWAEEQNTEVLLKIGMAKHNISYVDMLLSLLRKAAVSSGHKIRARNIVYLNVSSGKEMICSGGLTRFNGTFSAAAKEIAAVWPKISPPSASAGGPNEARA
jgi:hypothetical protein